MSIRGLLGMPGIVRIASNRSSVAGVETWLIAARFVDGFSVAWCAQAYHITSEQVELAIRFELKRRIKRMS
jgi:uncharacterized protein (DUF433 family)